MDRILYTTNNVDVLTSWRWQLAVAGQPESAIRLEAG